jgi:hypothetical protein
MGLPSLLGARSIIQMNLMSLCLEHILQMVACSPTVQANTTNVMTTIATLVQQFPKVFDELIGQLLEELHLDMHGYTLWI